MKVNRNFNPNYSRGYLGGTNEINYRITENDYTMEKNLALVLDTSSSMKLAWLNEKQKRIEVLAACVKTLINGFTAPGWKVSIFLCSENGRYLELHPAGSSSDTEDIISKLINQDSGGNTNLGDGIRKAYWHLNNCPEYSRKYMVILSDGETNSYTTTENSAQSAFMLDEGDALYTFKGSRALEYAKKVAGMVAEKGISTYAAALTTNTPNQLEAIAAACNALPLEDGKHYYRVHTGEEIQSIKEKIIASLPESISVSINYNEVFPYGVEVLSVREGLQISQLTDHRYCVKGMFDAIFMQNNSTGLYNFKTSESAIRLKYTYLGAKQFNGPSISYIYPTGKIFVAEIDNPLVYYVVG